MTDKHQEAFKEEAFELLIELEDSLLELGDSPEDMDLIGRVFRAMHTIKGSGAMFGFDAVAAFTHEIETVYDKVREGKIPVTMELIDLTLQARDQIRELLQDSPPGEALSKISCQSTVAAFKRLASEEETESSQPQRMSSEGASLPSNNNPSAIPDSPATYRIRFRPSPDIFLTGTNPLSLLNELDSMGECRVIAHMDAIPALEEIDPESCYAYWDIILTTDKGIDAIKDVFIFVEDESEVRIDVIETRGALSEPETDSKRIGEILIERGDIHPEDLQSALEEKKYIGEILVEKGLVTQDKVESALVEQKHVKKMQDKVQPKEEGTSSIRVPAEKLDTLVNLVGELVTVQARLSQTVSAVSNGELVAIAEEVERLTGELRDTTLNIRMLPIGTIFGRFKRLIHDLSRELGKDIEMTTDGAETELDKTVIERLNDPLVHLIRNSIDHGIEAPDVRTSRGKPKTGTIHLSAIHSGAHVVIQIRDDGKGLDREAILSKAIEKGLASPGIELTEKEIFDFIFAPGFSTAQKVTGVSGRGVGMDVVKRAIDALRGSIDVASEKGTGTVVTIKLPLTLAIIEGLLVKIDDNHFVLPLSIVEECVELTREDVKNSHGRDIANIRGQIVPYIKLRDEFDVPGPAPSIEQIVIAGVNGNRIGFVVDNVIGEHQTVIKNLGNLYKGVNAVSGATILGDGTVALIVDIPHLVNSAVQKTDQRA